MCQECQEIEVGYSESSCDISEGWDKTVEYGSRETLLNSGVKGEAEYKVCVVCLENKKISEFRFDKRFYDKHSRVCMLCEKVGAVPVTDMLKTCNTCGEEKPITCFGYLKGTKDGYSYTCKQCRNAYEIRNNSPDFEYAPKRVTIVDGKKCCTECGVWKVTEEFPKLTKSMDGLHYYCRECLSLISNKFFEKRKKVLDYSEISGTKVCTTCGRELDFSFFNKKIRGKFGFDSACRECRSLEGKERTKKVAFVPDLTLSKTCSVCGELKLATEFYKFKNHADGLASSCKECSNKKNKEFFANNLDARIRRSIRGRLHYFIYQGFNISADDALEFLGCTIPEFRLYIEKQFYKDSRSGREMSWDNYGYGDGTRGWDFEHMIPLSRVELQDPEQQKAVCHFSNIRPLWSWANSKKSNKLPSELGAEGYGV